MPRKGVGVNIGRDTEVEDGAQDVVLAQVGVDEPADLVHLAESNHALGVHLLLLGQRHVLLSILQPERGPAGRAEAIPSVKAILERSS